MKYQLQIQGMHCQGCKGLIQMSMEDENIKVDSIDVKEGNAVIESPNSELEQVEKQMAQIFKGLPGYSFTQLKQLI